MATARKALPLTNSFKVAYLLGVSDSILKSEFSDLYAKYEDLKLFDRVKGANKLRSMSRIRQSFIREHCFYRKCYSLPELISDRKGIDNEDVEILLKNDYDLSVRYRTLGNVTSVINDLTEEINKITMEVLQECGVCFPQKVAILFYLHILDQKRGLIQFANSISQVKFPYQQIVAKHSKVGKTIRYALLNDSNLLTTVSNILGEKVDSDFEFDETDTCYNNYNSESFIKRVGSDKGVISGDDNYENEELDCSDDIFIEKDTEDELPDESIIGASEDALLVGIINDFNIEADENNNSVITDDGVMSDSEVKAGADNNLKASEITDTPVDDVEVIDEKTETIEDTGIGTELIENALAKIDAKATIAKSAKKNDVAYTKVVEKLVTFMRGRKDIVVYVDCDNVNFFTFLGILAYLEGKKSIKEVRLYVDDKSTPIWNSLKDIYKTSLPLKTVLVHRVKENKSLTDMVIATDICQSVLRHNIHNIMLFSSDCDYFGVMKTLLPMDNKPINYAIGYSGICTSPAYLETLTGNSIMSFDSDVFANEELSAKYEETCIKFLIARNIANIPLICVNIERTKDIIYNALDKESLISVNRERVDEVLSVLRNKIAFKFLENNMLEVTVDDISVTLQQRGEK